jgi:hypothetical protein
MSASEKLKALPVAFDTSEQHSTAILLMDALPQIVAVVEAAERPRLEELVVGGMGEFCRVCENPVRRHRKTCALSALEEALS